MAHYRASAPSLSPHSASSTRDISRPQHASPIRLSTKRSYDHDFAYRLPSLSPTTPTSSRPTTSSSTASLNSPGSQPILDGRPQKIPRFERWQRVHEIDHDNMTVPSHMELLSQKDMPSCLPQPAFDQITRLQLAFAKPYSAPEEVRQNDRGARRNEESQGYQTYYKAPFRSNSSSAAICSYWSPPLPFSASPPPCPRMSYSPTFEDSLTIPGLDDDEMGDVAAAEVMDFCPQRPSLDTLVEAERLASRDEAESHLVGRHDMEELQEKIGLGIDGW